MKDHFTFSELETIIVNTFLLVTLVIELAKNVLNKLRDQ